MMILCSYGFSGIVSNTRTNEKSELINEKDAINRALQLTGFDEIDKYNARGNIEGTKIQKSKPEIPFLDNDDLSESIWQIDFRDVPIGAGTTRMISRDFTVFIDGKSGKLLMIYSISDNVGSSDTLPQPSAQVAELNMQKAEMSFNGLPDSLPRCKFIDVLKEVWGDPSNTKVIKAYFWNISDKRAVRTNTWLIVYYGMSTSIPISVPEGAQEPPFNQRNRLMTVINGDSGKAIYACTPII